MEAPPIPPDESERLSSLRKLGILDTPREERFDRITRLAMRLFGTPIALVSLVEDDRQWFKSVQGIEATQTSREVSFCAHAIVGEGKEILVVPDALQDPRFADNPYVEEIPNIRFYAGCPITAPDGAKLGTLCVIDDKPRDMTSDDQASLRDLAEMVEAEIATMDMAVTDELTGLANRRGYEILGNQVEEICKRKDLSLGVCFIDLDNMKPINDEHGHDVGDRALKHVADLLRGSFRRSDVIARIGGDEFCVLFTGSAAEGAEAAIGRLRSAVEQANERGDAPYKLSLSIGLATADAGGNLDIEALTEAADEAMYREKTSKKDPATR